MNNFIIPEQTRETDFITDPETGEVIKTIEHYRQGDHYYDIVHNTKPIVNVIDTKEDGTPYRTFSKLKIVAALQNLGVWPQVKSWIETNQLYDLYLAAQDFAENNTHFCQGLTALKSLLGMSAEQIEEILSSAVLQS